MGKKNLCLKLYLCNAYDRDDQCNCKGYSAPEIDTPWSKCNHQRSGVYPYCDNKDLREDK